MNYNEIDVFYNDNKNKILLDLKHCPNKCCDDLKPLWNTIKYIFPQLNMDVQKTIVLNFISTKYNIISMLFHNSQAINPCVILYVDEIPPQQRYCLNVNN